MNRTLRILATAAVALAIAGVVADAASLKVSLGTRETNKTSVAIGGDSGAANAALAGAGIEWTSPLDTLELPLDGQWRQYTFSLSSFSSTSLSGDGKVTGGAGSLENLRFVPSDAFARPYTVWIDDVAETEATGAESVISSFAGYADNALVMFEAPSYSGSTSKYMAASPNVAGVDNTVGHTDNSSVRVEFQFKDPADSTRWLRLTTYKVPTLPNPNLLYGEGNVATVWLKAVPEPASLSLLALGALFIRRRRA